MKSLLTYKISVLPVSHELQVEVQLELPLAGASALLQIPTWVPGSYRFQPYARDIFGMEAIDQASGKRLTVANTGWQGFRIEGASGAIRITYRVWAYDRSLSQACSMVDEDCAVLQGTQLLFVPGWSGACQVVYDLPKNWRLHRTGGTCHSSDPYVSHYENYESLLDSPAVAGTFDVLERRIYGTDFQFVFIDRALGFETEAEVFVDRLSAIAAECGRIFGGFPFPSYTFVLTTRPDLRWGLEHMTSSLCGLGPEVFVDPVQTARALRVCAHELFHAWNVRRLRPAPLGAPLDLTKGGFTEGLWLAEGFTRYYEFLVCTRTGDYTPQQFFSSIVNNWNHLTRAPAYRRVSAIESSRTSFLNHNTYPGSANASIDYYQKGMLIAFDLDARLRLQGDSLDAVMNDLFRSTSHSSAGYELSDVLEIVSARSQCGGKMLEREVTRPGSLSTRRQLGCLGFRPTIAQRCSLGVVVNEEKAEVTNVMDSSSAGRNGVAPGDLIRSINGFAFSCSALKWVAERSGAVALRVIRGHKERLFDLVPEPLWQIDRLEWQGTLQQASRIGAWLHTDQFRPRLGKTFDTSFYENFHGVEYFF